MNADYQAKDRAFVIQMLLVCGAIDVAMAVVDKSRGVHNWYLLLILAGWCLGWAAIWMYTTRKKDNRGIL